MNVRGPTDDEALSRTVTCDDCHQGPGIPCITMAGCPRSRRSHFSRYQQARGLSVVESVPVTTGPSIESPDKCIEAAN